MRASVCDAGAKWQGWARMPSFRRALDSIGRQHHPQLGSANITVNRSDQHPHAGPGNEQRDSSRVPCDWGFTGVGGTAIVDARNRMEDRFDYRRSLWFIVLQSIESLHRLLENLR